MCDRKCPQCGGYLRGGLSCCWDCMGMPEMDRLNERMDQGETAFGLLVEKNHEITQLNSLLAEIENIPDRHFPNQSLNEPLNVQAYNRALERCRKIARKRNK